MSTYNIPFQYKKKMTLNHSKSAAMGLFPWDSRTSSKQLWYSTVCVIFKRYCGWNLVNILQHLALQKRNTCFQAC